MPSQAFNQHTPAPLVVEPVGNNSISNSGSKQTEAERDYELGGAAKFASTSEAPAILSGILHIY
jgi:hypothetical protein